METYIAREPILDGNQTVFAFQLHRRPPLDPHLIGAELEDTSARVISDLAMLLGVEAVTEGHRAIIRVSHDVLCSDFVMVLPAPLTIVEVPVPPSVDRTVVDACRRLKDRGYGLVAADITTATAASPLVQIADLLKIDFAGERPEPRLELGRSLATRGKSMIASGVDGWKLFRLVMQNGFRYAAGGFFTRPRIVVSKDVTGAHMSHLAIVLEIHQPEVDFSRIEAAIKQDVSLSYKLLRCINSSYFGVRNEVKSIKHALVLMGERDLKRWVSLIALTSIADRKPPELVQEAVLRACLCESLASEIGLAHRDQELYLLGLLSVLDAILDRPLSAILDTLPLADDMRRALRSGGDDRLGGVLRCALAYLGGDWETFSQQATRIGLDESRMPALYVDALKWVHSTVAQMPRAA